MPAEPGDLQGSVPYLRILRRRTNRDTRLIPELSDLRSGRLKRRSENLNEISKDVPLIPKLLTLTSIRNSALHPLCLHASPLTAEKFSINLIERFFELLSTRFHDCLRLSKLAGIWKNKTRLFETSLQTSPSEHILCRATLS